MMFAAGWRQAPRDCLDLGTGVGLPGLVLAIVWPQTGFELVDRSEKRCDLARRAARVADVDVTVTQADIWSLDRTSVAIVSRAAIPAQRFRPLLERMLAEGGRAVISGSGAAVEGFENLEILDRPSRLLMMQKS
jgi:16S rRNA (guanine527-N7)-methyltransferase